MRLRGSGITSRPSCSFHFSIIRDLKYYVLIKGRGYWRPTKRMKELGFSDICCGSDGPATWKIAADWNERWQKVRRGEETAPAALPPQKLTREQTELARRYPRGSVGVGFQRLLCTDEWSSRALSTRTGPRGFGSVPCVGRRRSEHDHVRADVPLALNARPKTRPRRGAQDD